MTRIPNRLRAAAALAGALATAAAAAHAATPATGDVSAAAPFISWKGQVTNSYPARVLAAETGDGTEPCEAPTCDEFTLNVKDSDDLVITADAPKSTSTTGSSGSQITLRVKEPDGTYIVYSGDGDTDKPGKIAIKKAKTGTYVVDYWNYFYGTATDYNGTATLGKPSAPAGNPAGNSGASTSNPTTAPSSSNSTQGQAIQLVVKAKGGSAKKLNKARKLAATVSLSRPVATVQAQLAKGKTVVGRANLGASSGTVKLSLKLAKKLKPGTYKLNVKASDGQGITASKTIAVKVKK